MRRAALIGLLVPIVVLAIVKFIPYLQGQAPSVNSTPAVQPLRQAVTVGVEPGERLCVTGLVMGPQSRYAQFAPQDSRRGRPSLTVSAFGDSFRSATKIQRAPLASGTLTVKLDPPRSEVDGSSICLRNRGTFDIRLFGVPPGLDSTASETTVNGVPIREDVSLTLLRETSTSRAANLPEMLNRASVFLPFGPWASWLLAIVLVVGVPAALGVALARSCPEDGK